MGRFFEISKKNSKGGRRKIKMSLLEIHTDEKATNKNGIHWKEEYILNNLDSISEMPICCEFIDRDEKRVPYAHGLTGIDSKENEPIFKDSESVGCISKAYPADVEINGETKRVLLGEGYIYAQRYPNFVEWLNESLDKGNVLSSIEIMGTAENNNIIIYENDDNSQEFRVPKEFDFSATAIISVEAADDSALILQLNSKKNTESEGKQMNEEVISQIKEIIKKILDEYNTQNSNYEEKISELDKVISEKDGKITELTTQAEQVQKALEDLRKEQEGIWAEREALEKELGELKAKIRLSECNAALSNFTDEEKDYAKAEIEAFNADPMSIEVNSIVTKINAEIGKKAKAAIIAEQNAHSGKTDIFGEIFEGNSATNTGEVSIF